MINTNATSSSPGNPAQQPPPPQPPPPHQSMATSSSTTSTTAPAAAATSSTATTSANTDGSGKKVRKPYTITKSRESWTDEEHDKFLEALQLFDRDWKKIEDFVGSKTVIQIRSHAQKYFLKVQKNGTIAHVPPPRPKRKAAHPYPQKASKNVSMSYPTTMNTLAPGYAPWDDSSMLINSATSQIMQPQDEFMILPAAEALLMAYNITDSADIGSKGVPRLSNNSVNSGLGTSGRTLPSSEIAKQGKQAPVLHGIPDFAEVYSFIGSVFDPDTKGHVQKLKEMDPINFETVLLLMRNLSVNLSCSDFEPLRKMLSSNDINNKTTGVAATNQANDIAC